jgi:hypothetical protein
MMNRIPLPRMKYPLIAILRGLKAEEAESVVGTLIETGFTAIEIPLNSPDPFRSIETAAKMAPSDCLIGAGTVLTTAQVEQLADVGGRLMVSPNVEPSVIRLAAAKGMVTMPGVFTPTEALAAAADTPPPARRGLNSSRPACSAPPASRPSVPCFRRISRSRPSAAYRRPISPIMQRSAFAASASAQASTSRA